MIVHHCKVGPAKDYAFAQEGNSNPFLFCPYCGKPIPYNPSSTRGIAERIDPQDFEIVPSR